VHPAHRRGVPDPPAGRAAHRDRRVRGVLGERGLPDDHRAAQGKADGHHPVAPPFAQKSHRGVQIDHFVGAHGGFAAGTTVPAKIHAHGRSALTEMVQYSSHSWFADVVGEPVHHGKSQAIGVPPTGVENSVQPDPIGGDKRNTTHICNLLTHGINKCDFALWYWDVPRNIDYYAFLSQDMTLSDLPTVS